MGDLLTSHAANQPDKAAVIDDRTGGDVRRLTYAELEDRSNQLVHVLADLGFRVGRSDRYDLFDFTPSMYLCVRTALAPGD